MRDPAPAGRDILAAMAGRTFAIGDIHGDADALYRLLALLPRARGDRHDRLRRRLPRPRAPSRRRSSTSCASLPAADAARRSSPCAATTRTRGCASSIAAGPSSCCRWRTAASRRCARSWAASPPRGRRADEDRRARRAPQGHLLPAATSSSGCTPCPIWYEDDHAIYVHAGLPARGRRLPPPVEGEDADAPCSGAATSTSSATTAASWSSSATPRPSCLPPELSSYTPEDPTDIWAGPCTIGLDTGCGKGGFLTALELPSLRVYESR